MARKNRGDGKTRRDVRQLAFDPDPGHLLPADFELGGTGGWQPRIVYADHLPI